MAFIPITNTAQFDFRGVLNGEQVENTLYFTNETAITSEDLQNAADGLSIWWGTQMTSVLAQQYIYTSVFARDLTTSTSVEVESFEDGGTPGSQMGNALPNNVSWAIKFLTGLAGRSFRGRNYVAGLNDGMVVGQAILIGRADDLVTIYEQLMGVAQPAGWEWVIASRYSDNAPRVAGVTTPVTTVGYTDLFIDSQRRRLPGRGT